MRLLATQSHVVHGYVGNKAATFPLQCLGWDVDCCNTVQFANHTGYGKVVGDPTTAAQLDQLLSGVLHNFPHDYCALLSGYSPHADSIKRVGIRYAQYKAQNPDTLWLMDPVMGDEGKLYVSEDVIPIYRQLVFEPTPGRIDIITPNQFELELLHGSPVTTLDELKDTLASFHRHIPIIVVTSLDSRMFQDPRHIYCVASQRGRPPVILKVPLIESYFTGVGDIFAALLVDRIYRHRAHLDLVSCVNDVLNVVQTLLQVTTRRSSLWKTAAGAVAMGSRLMQECELRIVECRDLYAEAAGGGALDFTYKTLY